MKKKDDTNISITKEQKLKELTDKWWKLVLEQVKTWHLVDSDKLKIASIPLSDDKQIELDELEENIESISSQLGIRPPFMRVRKIDANSYEKKMIMARINQQQLLASLKEGG